MRRFVACFVMFAFVSVVPAAFAQELTTEQVLAKLDEKARVFTSVQSSIKFQGVNFGIKLPEESGKLTIAMANGSPRILFDITEPEAARKKTLIDKGKGTMYTPGSNSFRTMSIDPKSEQLQLILLGFGTPVATINKGYKSEAKGRETMGGVQAVVLELTSISKSTDEFPTITLWLDPQTWTPIQTRLARTPKKYNDFKYSNVQLNRSVSNGVFDLKMPKDAREQ